MSGSTTKTRLYMSYLYVVVMSCVLAFVFVSTRQPRQVIHDGNTKQFETAFFQSAKVYGRAGCGDQKLTEMTAKDALATNLPPQLIAAIVAAESGCNPLAVSSKGAVGLTQIVPKTWGKIYDFSKINLFNPEDNMLVGADILSKLVKDHGVRGGLIRYYGTGADDIGMGGVGYADKVLQLAGKL